MTASPEYPLIHPRFLITGQKDTGGMGVVYRATDRLTSGTVILKTVSRETSPKEMSDQLIREFLWLHELRHPSVPEVYDLFAGSGNTVFYTMEWIDGQSLDKVIKDKLPLSETEFFSLLFQLLLILDYMNRKNVVHRDIKPSNIMIRGLSEETGNSRPEIIIIDFGLAFRASDQTPSAEQAALSGTIQYSAPEVIKKAPFDQRSDLYSLGVVLYEWMSGVNPFDAEELIEVVVNHLEKKIDTLTPCYGFIPEVIIPVVLKCLNKNPEHRYQNTGEIFRDLFKSDVIRDRWDSFQRDRAFFLNESYFDHDQVLIRQTERISAVSASANNLLERILIRGVPSSGKTALLHELKIRAEASGFITAGISAQIPAKPLENMERLVSQIHFLCSDPDESRNFVPLRLFQSEDAEQEIIEYLYRISGRHSLWMWIIDSEHLLSDQERELLQNFYARMKSHPNTRFMAIHSILRDGPFSNLDHGKTEDPGLSPIRSSAIAGFIRHLLFLYPYDEEFIDFASKRSDGNPFLIRETVRFCLLEKHLCFDGFQYRFQRPDLESLPDSVQSFMIRKLDFLPDYDLRLLRHLSLYDGSWTIQEITGTTGDPAVLQRLNLLSRSGFVIEKGLSYQVQNSYLRMHLYGSIRNEERILLHRKLADYYQSFDQELFLEKISFHLMGGGKTGEALPFLTRLGERYKEEKKYLRALEQLETAYTILKAGTGPEKNIELLAEIISLCDKTANRKKQLDYLNVLKRCAEQNRNPQHLIEYESLFGNYLESISSYDQMERHLRTAIQIADEHQFREKTSSLHRMLGKSYYQRARWQDALVSYQRALSELPAASDSKTHTEILNSIGTVYGTLRKWDLAMNVFRQVLDSASRNGDEKSKLNALINLGFLAHLNNDEKTALDFYSQAREAAEPFRNRKYEQRLYQYMGISYRFVKKFEKALEYLEQSARISSELNDTQTLGKSLSEQAVIYHQLGNYEESVRYMQKAILTAKNLDNQKDLSVRKLRFAEILLDSGNLTDSAEYFYQAKPFTDEYGDEEWKVYSFWIGIRLLREKALSDKTGMSDLSQKDRFEPFIKICQKNRFDSLLVLLYGLMADLARDSGNLTEALDYSSKAIKQMEKTGHFEFDESGIYYRHFQIQKDMGVSRRETGIVLLKAYEQTAEAEKSFTRSALKEGYHFKHIVKTIREEYRMFFSEELQFRQESFGVLFDIVRSINSVLEPDDLFEVIMDEAIRHSGADRGLILIPDENRDTFDVKTARHIEPSDMKDVTQISLSIVREVYTSGKPVVTADAQTDDRFRERQSVLAYHIRSIMCVPLKIRNKIAGAVYVDKQFDANYFTESNVQFLESFAHLAAIAIENARLYRNLRDEKDSLQKENIDLRHLVREKYMTHNIVGRSKPMADVFRMIDMAAASGAPVIIEGESGTGKELAAKAIHFNSPRKDKPFVTVDCGSLTESLLETELFGYKKGAFTGAVTDKKGLFEEADGGTLFLDEISNTSLNFQSKLLRVIQESEIRRVGDSRTRKIDVRIITATNRSLNQEVQQNRFREDLFYRLNVLRIYLPPLRERHEDIPLLIHFFIQRYNTIHNKNVETLSQDLLTVLTGHSWPGNIRELDNLMNRMVLFSKDRILLSDDLPDEMKSFIPRNKSKKENIGIPQDKDGIPFGSITEMEQYLFSVEKDYFTRILESADGNKSKAAEILAIKRTTLNDRLKKLGLL